MSAFAKVCSTFWAKVESLRAYVTTRNPASMGTELATLIRAVEVVNSNPAIEQHDMDGMIVEETLRGLQSMSTLAQTAQASEGDADISAPLLQLAFIGLTDPKHLDLVKRIHMFSQSLPLIYESSLIALISSFELLLATLLRRYYRRYPQALPRDEKGQEKGLLISQLVKFPSIAEAIDYVVEQRVDSLMRANPDAWKATFQRTYKVNIDELCYERRNDLSEAFQRRNLVVHNDSIVDEQYSRWAKKNGTPYQVGDRIEVTQEYIVGLLDLFSELGLKLIDICWADESADELSLRDESIHTIIVECVLTGRWSLAGRLCTYALERGTSTSDFKLGFQFNKWLCDKRQGNCDLVIQQSANLSPDTIPNHFTLALHSLRNDFEAFMDTLGTVVQSGASIQYIYALPIFEEMRQHPEFQTRTSAILDIN